MKRFVTLILAAGLVFGAAGGAKAVDINASGYWDFALDWHRSSFDKDNTSDRFSGVQRLRTQIDVIASESLKGVFFFEIGKTNWGRASQGGSLGTDGYTVKVRYSYIDWAVPDSELQFRMGLQPYLLPNFVAGSTILDGDGAGITASYEFNENVGATLFWLRAENNNVDGVEFRGHTFRDNQNDALDILGLTIPVRGEGFKITPWGMFSFVGNRSLIDPDNSGDIQDLRAGFLPVFSRTMVSPDFQTNKPDGRAWWAGIGGELTLFAPWRLAAEGAYGSVDMGKISGGFTPRGNLAPDTNRTIDVKRDGWYAAAIAEYKLDVITPGLIFWYGSGDDDNPYNGSERLPYIDPNWEGTTFGYKGARFDDEGVISNSVSGTWGVGARIKDLSFIETLNHMIQVSYIRGTNSKHMPRNAGMTSAVDYTSDSDGPEGLVYMTTKDYAVEVDFNTEYQMYKDLSFLLETGWIHLKLDEDVWGSGIVNATEKNAYKVALNLRYTF